MAVISFIFFMSRNPVSMFQNRHSGFQRAQFYSDAEDVTMQDAGPLMVNGASHQSGFVESQRSTNGNAPEPRRNRLVIAIDFGTTFSTVAYVAIEHDRPGFSVRPQHVLCVDHYPDIPANTTSANLLESNENVPTELWYTEGASEERQSPPDTSDIDLTGYYTDSSNDEPTRGDPWAGSVPARDGTRRQYLWGFGVHEGLLRPHDGADTRTIVRRFKLMLDVDGAKTLRLRKGLSSQTRLLKRRKAIAKNR